MQQIPELPKEIIIMILEHKHNNFKKITTCKHCGAEDFKTCDFTICCICKETWCSNTENLEEWVWTCYACNEDYCGKHIFYNIESETYCAECIQINESKMDIRNRPPAHYRAQSPSLI